MGWRPSLLPRTIQLEKTLPGPKKDKKVLEDLKIAVRPGPTGEQRGHDRDMEWWACGFLWGHGSSP